VTIIRPRRLLPQMFAVAAATLGAALLVNALHPQGIELGRDYFAKPQHDFAVVSAEDFRSWSEYLNDPAGDFIYLDARRHSQYERGHVPGAYCVPRNDEEALQIAVTAAGKAMVVAIYCHGGNCEDAIFLAEDLVYRQGLDPGVVMIYEGGWEEWQKSRGPEKQGPER
jgi:rhodanese-related sulfurtransferase